MNTASTSSADSTKGVDLADFPFLNKYLKSVEDFPDDIARVLSKFKESKAQLLDVMDDIEEISQQDMNATNRSLIHSMVVKLKNLNDEKLQYALELNELVNENRKLIDRESKLSDPKIEIKRVNSLPKLFNRMMKNKRKRGRQPRKINGTHSPSQSSNGEPRELMMLADVAITESEIAEGKDGKIPVTKRVDQKRKRSRVKKSDHEGASEIDDTEEPDLDAVEVDENEPLYCLCNKPSFGNMIMCDNESCFIEWFHFGCLNLKKSPKGKWYCPKCRGKKSSALKKELIG